MIWILVTDDGHVESFSTRPHTDNDPDNWPPHFRLYEGYVDGGDTALIEER